jgi:nucleoside phosphorylase
VAWRAGSSDLRWWFREKVVIYDIAEGIGDSQEAIAEYTTTLRLPPSFPVPVVKVTIYSADRDLTTANLQEIENRFRPVVADWESGPIAWVATKNATPLLIIRGVSDIVGAESSETQGNLTLFEANTVRVMHRLVSDLPEWSWFCPAWMDRQAIRKLCA